MLADDDRRSITIAQDSGVIVYRAGQVDAVPMSFVPPDVEAMKAGTEPALAAEVTIDPRGSQHLQALGQSASS